MIKINKQKFRSVEEMQVVLYKKDMERRRRGGKYRPIALEVPGSLQKIKAIEVDLNVTRKTNIPSVPIVPTKGQPRIADKYHAMAKHVGMSAFELSQIMEDEIDPDNPLIMDALKRLVMTIKMAKVVDFSMLNQTLKNYEDTYQSALHNYHSSVLLRNQIIEQRDKEIKLHSGKIRTVWLNVLTGLVARCQDKPLKQVSEWDNAYLCQLEMLGSRYCKKNQDNTYRIKVGWCKKLEVDAIILLQNEVKRFMDEQYDLKFREWLFHSDEAALRHELWLVNDDDERNQINNEINRIRSLDSSFGRYNNPWDDPYENYHRIDDGYDYDV